MYISIDVNVFNKFINGLKEYKKHFISKKLFMDVFCRCNFQGKKLLGVVMGNDKIKVRFRKVTNDGKVSSRLISWEQSNKWSGEKKWSKNMTLFLAY